MFFFIIFWQTISCQNQLDVGAQYMYQRSMINPAAMFQHDDLSIVLLSRQQWVGFNGAPRSNVFRLAQVSSTRAIGVSINQELIGNYSFTKVLGSLGKRIRLSKRNYLSFGLSGGLFFRGPIDRVETIDEDVAFFSKEIFVKPDFDFGIYLEGEKYYVGISIPSVIGNHIYFDESKKSYAINVDPKYFHYYLDGGYGFELNRLWELKSFVFLKFLQNSPVAVDTNLIFEYQEKLGLGISYRHPNRIGALINFQISDRFKMGYSYEITMGFTESVLNTHEFSIFYNLSKKKGENRGGGLFKKRRKF